MDVEEDGAITNAFVIANRLDLRLAVHERVFNSSVVVEIVLSGLFQEGTVAKFPMSLLGPRTSIGNNVQHAGSSSPPRSHCRTGLQLGPARDTAHSFFARFEGPSGLGGWHSRSTALSGQKMTPPVCVGAYS